MKEEDLKKAIELKKKLDNERELLEFANSHYVGLRVELDEDREPGRIINIDYLLDKDVTKGLRAMVIAKIEKNINDLQEELEKL